jgi:hypothetical protein
MTLLLVTILFASTHYTCVRIHHQLTLGIYLPQASIIIKEKLIAHKTMHIPKITFTITEEDAFARHAKQTTRKEASK